ncbi:hypothetical protein [Listeria fleischmannii]|uniref:hypothetical protein n=1 Tax=Listeria fleischmannii TaxID=1069827 RepID=UPI001628F990|nr:hypothetical protein [Listeria fleischmannii]MBC1420177.1 hypothetical protein [Listeria fleischmannii]
MKKREIEQNLDEITRELKSIRKLLVNVGLMVADEVNFNEQLTDYMTELFHSHTNMHPDEIYLTGKIKGGRELHQRLY